MKCLEFDENKEKVRISIFFHAIQTKFQLLFCCFLLEECAYYSLSFISITISITFHTIYPLIYSFFVSSSSTPFSFLCSHSFFFFSFSFTTFFFFTFLFLLFSSILFPLLFIIFPLGESDANMAGIISSDQTRGKQHVQQYSTALIQNKKYLEKLCAIQY